MFTVLPALMVVMMVVMVWMANVFSQGNDFNFNDMLHVIHPLSI